MILCRHVLVHQSVLVDEDEVRSSSCFVLFDLPEKIVLSNRYDLQPNCWDNCTMSLVIAYPTRRVTFGPVGDQLATSAQDPFRVSDGRFEASKESLALGILTRCILIRNPSLLKIHSFFSRRDVSFPDLWQALLRFLRNCHVEILRRNLSLL